VSGPWDDYAPAPAAAGNPWEDYAPPEATSPEAGRQALERSGDPRFAPSANVTYNKEEPQLPIWDRIKRYASDVPGAINAGVNVAGTQFVKGINGLIGLPNTLQDLGLQGAAIVQGHGADFKPPHHVMPTAESMNDLVFNKLGLPEYNVPSFKIPTSGDKTIDLGQATNAGLQAIPTFGGSGVAAAIPGFAAGATSDVAGQATAGTPFEPYARIAGGSLGYRVGSKAVTPLPANLTPNQARLVDVAKENNIPLSVSQETGNGKMLERIAGRFPTGHGPFENLREAQQTGTDRMALKEAGIEGERTDPESMKGVAKEAGKNFGEALKDVSPVKLDDTFYSKLGNAESKYNTITAENSRAPIVRNTVDNYLSNDLVKDGSPTLSPDQYQSYRRDLGETMNGLKPGDPEYKFLKSTRDALDDAMVTSSPADKAAAMSAARRQYMNYKIVGKAAANSTSAARTEGNISPAALNSSLKRAQGDKFSETTGGLNDVASLKQYLTDTFPNSGTPTIGAGHAGIMGGGMLLGEHGLAMLSDPKILGGAAALLAGPRVLSQAVTGRGAFLSPAIRKYLVNQAMVQANPGLYSRGGRSVPFTLAPGLAVGLPPFLEDRR
jgi:hypothetical protein